MKISNSFPRPWLVAVASLVVFGGAATVWYLQGDSKHPVHTAEKLAIGVADAFFTIPVLVAEDQGFFREAGLEATFQHFPSGKAAMDIMIKDGSLDVVTVSDTPIALAAMRHQDVTAIGNFSRAANDTKTIARANIGITKAGDLRGKRVGVAVGTIADYCLNVLLTDEGMAMDSIVRVPLGSDKLAATLARQEVDAVATYEPYGSYARTATQDQGVVLNNPGRCVVTTGYISKHALPKEHQTAVQRLLIGTEHAIVWMQKNRSSAISIAARKLNVDPQTVVALWDSYDFSLSLEQAFLNSLDAQAKWVVSNGMAPSGPPPNFLEYVDLTALTAVKPGAVSIIH